MLAVGAAEVAVEAGRQSRSPVLVDWFDSEGKPSQPRAVKGFEKEFCVRGVLHYSCLEVD